MSLQVKMKFINKTQAAFTFTCENLFNCFPKIYFWTFTFVYVPRSDDDAMDRYNRLIKRLKKHFPAMKGVRVCELHRSHGIHFHLFLNIRIPVKRIMKISRGTGLLSQENFNLGFGRISVERCDKNTVGYLADYLTKQYRQDNWFGQRRRWGCIGGWQGSKVADIEYDTPENRNRKTIYGERQCDYGTYLMIKSYTKLWGEVSEWPEDCRGLIYKQRDVRAAVYKNLRDACGMSENSSCK